MTAHPHADDPRLLSVASAIAKGERVDWAALPAVTDPETTTILDELRALEGVCQASSPIPDAWGPFRITGELGHGSYGTVYSALDHNLGVEVALKVIRAGANGEELDTARALNEARLLAQVNHPNVVRVYWAEQIGQEVGISMELVRGRTLHWLVRANGPFSASETMLIGVDLCRAVAAVHGARLLHGDIKANNVMRATGGRAVLMDFGAGYDQKSATRRLSRRTAGTPIYLAPEVLDGEPRSKASDIYSLGVLLFYLATGTYPVDGQTRDDIERTHEARAPRRLLRDVRPDLPESFIHVVERATAELPEDRYQTAGELEAALSRASREDDPVPVPTPTRWPLPLAAALAVVLLGIGYQTWSSRPDTIASAPGATAAGVVTPAPAPVPAGSYDVEAAFYRQQRGNAVRLQPGARVAPGDQLSLQIQTSVPSYVYVVNEDDQGESYLLYPLPGQHLTNPVPPGERHEIPGVVNGERVTWVVSSAGGREHFLVFVSPQPVSPAFERLFASLPRPTAGAPTAQRVPDELASALRGVGGLAKAPARPAGERLSNEFAVPLPDARETARGVWVRQLTLENPGK
jgi:eukaryotic-like serine/threonine-protein kinase